MVYLHELSTIPVGKTQKTKNKNKKTNPQKKKKTFFSWNSPFLSKSFVDPIPIMGKVILSTTLLPFLHSAMVSNILCGKRTGFITLPKNKITENHGLLLLILSKRVLGVNLCFVYYEVWIVDWFQRIGFLGRPLGKTLWLHASSVSQSVCQTFSIRFLHRSYLFNAKTDQVHMWCAYAL